MQKRPRVVEGESSRYKKCQLCCCHPFFVVDAISSAHNSFIGGICVNQADHGHGADAQTPQQEWGGAFHRRCPSWICSPDTRAWWTLANSNSPHPVRTYVSTYVRPTGNEKTRRIRLLQHLLIVIVYSHIMALHEAGAFKGLQLSPYLDMAFSDVRMSVGVTAIWFSVPGAM